MGRWSGTPEGRLGHGTSGTARKYLLHRLHRVIPFFHVLREETPSLVGDDEMLHVFYHFSGAPPDLRMEKQLRMEHPSAIVDFGIHHGLAWSFSTTRSISDVEEATSSSIEPVRRNIFHLLFFAQRLIRLSTP